jgi:hypothetical protein
MNLLYGAKYDAGIIALQILLWVIAIMSVNAAIFAFASILLFMMVYYQLSGLIANVALFFNVVFVVAVMASIGSTLTLPGIALLVYGTAGKRFFGSKRFLVAACAPSPGSRRAR